MGREIRRVPANWKHPKGVGGREFQPLSDNYLEHLKYFKEDVEDFIKHMTDVIEKGETIIYDNVFKTPQEVYDYLNEDNQMCPTNVNGYMPSGKWYQLFETVSEGTPLSPPFETKEELIEWLTNNVDYWGNKWSSAGAKDIVESGFALSGIFSGGKMYSPEEQHLLK